jgi:hypothetical protein
LECIDGAVTREISSNGIPVDRACAPSLPRAPEGWPAERTAAQQGRFDAGEGNDTGGGLRPSRPLCCLLFDCFREDGETEFCSDGARNETEFRSDGEDPASKRQ